MMDFARGSLAGTWAGSLNVQPNSKAGDAERLRTEPLAVEEQGVATRPPLAMHSVTPQISFPLSPLAKSLHEVAKSITVSSRWQGCLSGETR